MHYASGRQAVLVLKHCSGSCVALKTDCAAQSLETRKDFLAVDEAIDELGPLWRYSCKDGPWYQLYQAALRLFTNTNAKSLK